MEILQGIPVSPGIVQGKVFVIQPSSLKEPAQSPSPISEKYQLQKYCSAVQSAQKALEELVQGFPSSAQEQAAIFQAQQEMLVDEEVVQKIETMIRDQHACAYKAVDTVYSCYVELLSVAPNALIASRAVDLKDVRNRLLRILEGQHETSLHDISEPVILVAHELLPSEIVSLTHEKVLGFITEEGGSTSHAAILARSCGIPAVLGVPSALEKLQQASEIVLDAISGTVVVHPDSSTLDQYAIQQEKYLEDKRSTEAVLREPASTACGEKISIGLNISSTAEDLPIQYSDFVGLFRTEFAYMENVSLPTEEHQYSLYRQVLENAVGKPVILRTLDAGGDKPIPALEHPKERNPFLGNRGVRLSLTYPDLFRTQLRAILRASACGDLHVMFPMVSSIEELRKARAYLETEKTKLREEGITFNEDLKIGVMIETPAIAFVADQLVQEVDFASVGTNDLAQYMHAADRTNPAMMGYYQSLSPAMLRLLAQIANAFQEAGKPISVCGELAGDPIGALALMAVGFRSLSMEASQIAGVKSIISKFTISELMAIAPTLLHFTTEKEVIQFLKTSLDAHS